MSDKERQQLLGEWSQWQEVQQAGPTTTTTTTTATKPSTIARTPSAGRAPAAAEWTTGGKPKCPRCHHLVELNDKFCGHCGNKITVVQQQARCAKCQEALPSGAKFCESCGHKV